MILSVQFLSFSCSFQQKSCQKRMHSSRMRTARLLPISPRMHCSGRGCTSPGSVCTYPGVPAWGRVPGRERGVPEWGSGVPARGVYLPRGCTCLGIYLPGGCTCLGGASAWECICLWGVYLSGVYLPGRCTFPGGVPAGGVPAQVLSPVNRMTDRQV